MDNSNDRRQFLKWMAIAPLALTAGCSQSAVRDVSFYRQRLGFPQPREIEQDVEATQAASPFDFFKRRDEGLFRRREEGFNYDRIYGAKYDGGFQLPAIPWKKIDKRFLRQRVTNFTGAAPGTILVDTSKHFLYFVEGGGSAMRYGVGLGRAGFAWAGGGEIGRKQEWPRWHPPEEMIARQPELQKFKTTYDAKNDKWLGGQEPGLRNPLGARAMYIHQNGKDTLYRIHGSPEWASIGKSVSSGCVRMMNQDVVDLYSRANVGAKIVVGSGLKVRFG